MRAVALNIIGSAPAALRCRLRRRGAGDVHPDHHDPVRGGVGPDGAVLPVAVRPHDHQETRCGAGSMIGNIIWIVLAGWWLSASATSSAGSRCASRSSGSPGSRTSSLSRCLCCSAARSSTSISCSASLRPPQLRRSGAAAARRKAVRPARRRADRPRRVGGDRRAVGDARRRGRVDCRRVRYAARDGRGSAAREAQDPACRRQGRGLHRVPPARRGGDARRQGVHGGRLPHEPADVGHPLPRRGTTTGSTPPARPPSSAASCTRSSTGGSTCSTSRVRRRRRSADSSTCSTSSTGATTCCSSRTAPTCPIAVAATAWDHLLGCPRMNEQVFDAVRAFRNTYVDKGPEIVP